MKQRLANMLGERWSWLLCFFGTHHAPFWDEHPRLVMGAAYRDRACRWCRGRVGGFL